MKLFAKTALLAGILAFSSCSKDDGGASTTPTTQTITTAKFNELIVGDWEMTAFEQKNGTSEFNGITTNFESVGTEFGGEITFKSDSTTFSAHYYSFDKTESVNGGPAVVTDHEIPSVGYYGDYEVKSITELETSALDGGHRIYTVTDLTETTMTLETHIVDNFGSALINVDVIYSLKKK